MLMTAALATLAMAAPSAPATPEVTVWDKTGDKPRRCSSIDASDPKRLTGGCLISVESEPVQISVRTMVGDVDFANCTYDHDLRIDGSGRTYTVNVKSGGKKPCNDIDACVSEHPSRPWPGQIHTAADGSFHHLVQTCFDTCMGQFRGELRLDLTPTENGWRETIATDLVGVSGLQFEDGSWDLEPNTIELRT